MKERETDCEGRVTDRAYSFKWILSKDSMEDEMQLPNVGVIFHVGIDTAFLKGLM